MPHLIGARAFRSFESRHGAAGRRQGHAMDLQFTERFFGIFALLLSCSFLFHGIPKGLRGKAPTARGWMWFSVVSGVVVTVLLLIPPYAFLISILAALTLVLGLFVLGWIDTIWVRANVARSRSRARVVARDGPESFQQIDSHPPPEFEPHALAFERLGFKRVRYGGRGEGTQLVMFRPSDCVTAEVASYPKVKAVWSFELLDLTSVLIGRRGLLTTTNAPTHQRLWRGELLQVFPGASATQLVESHDAALALLARRGVVPEKFDESAIEEYVRWGLQMLSMAQAETRSREIVRRNAPTELMKSLQIGPLQDDQRLDDLVAALPEPAEP